MQTAERPNQHKTQQASRNTNKNDIVVVSIFSTFHSFFFKQLEKNLFVAMTDSMFFNLQLLLLAVLRLLL